MAIHYNAFISYRHHPDDIRVASDIHRSLERFRVPKDLRRQGKSITRLFRDKDELPITSSLTSDIFEALENSDYLIVICSVHTKESIWVQREIETFLKTHRRNRVLTVLASGEPYDVIPEILLREQVVDPDTGELEWKEIEPLSCDWRLKRKLAVREELPRLAAALLGCSYDQLRQRQRQYRMRRMITFFSIALAASLALSAYFLHTNIQIQKANDALHEANIQIQDNLDQALRNQSDYLGSVSQERMDAGDRLTALALALEGLPNTENNRPYVANAEYALSNALASYRSTTQIRAVGAMDVDTLVTAFRVTDDGSRIYILDSRNIITLWDTATFQKLTTMELDAYRPQNLSVTPGGNVFFQSDMSSSQLLCYDQNGDPVWEVPNCMDTAFYDEGKTLLVLCNDYVNPMQIRFIDPETGADQRSSLILSNTSDGTHVSFSQDIYAGDTALTLFCDTFDEDILCHLDPETGVVRELLRIESGFTNGSKNIDAVSAIDQDRILIMVTDGSGMMNGSYGTYHLYSASNAQILCYSLSAGKPLWQSDISTHVFSPVCTMQPISGTNSLLCQRGNTFCILDAETGETLTDAMTPSAPVSITVEPTVAWGILESGQYYEYTYEKENCITIPILDGTVSAAEVKDGAFLLSPLSTQVRIYRSIKDDRGELLTDSMDIGITTSLQHGNYLVLKDSYRLYLFSTAENRLLWCCDASYSDELLEFAANGSGFWIWDDKDKCVKFLDVDSGESTAIPIPDKLEGEYASVSSLRFCSNGHLIYALTGNNRRAILQIDLATGETKQWDLMMLDASYYGKTTSILASDASQIIYWEQNGSITRLDTADGNLQRILEDVETAPVAAWNSEHNMIAVTVGHEIVLMNIDGSEKIRFSLDTRKGVSMYFWNHELLVLCDDGSLWRYDLQGTALSHTRLSIYNTFSAAVRSAGTSKLDISWHETADGNLLLNALGAGNLVDTNQWECRAFITNLRTYLTHTNQILCSGDDGFYFYRIYSTEEQILYAKQILGNFELSAKEKEYYGLD